ncbi:MAG: hypothetical protein H6728_04870 [Myxococcales bacterium]|nr:hypothetical protein [Myxococcales bacterium]MCB9642385.1 hypothetical protein [Myxococcales bacterium]
MQEYSLQELIEPSPSLNAVFVTAMPDCLLFDSYEAQPNKRDLNHVASYVGDLVRANREVLRSLEEYEEDAQITVETKEYQIILKELDERFVAGFLFNRKAPIGMVRLQVDKMLKVLRKHLESYKPEEIPRVVQVLDYLQRYAPDPHASMMRVALKTGLPLQTLQNPQGLNEQQLANIEESVRQILGLKTLHL